MRAAFATAFSTDDPLAGLVVGERPEPVAPDGWVRVRLAAASLNHHDVWTLRGVGITADRLPMILGCDGAGWDEDGREVVIYSVIASPDGGDGDETTDPGRSLLSERHQGTLADYVVVPRRNVLAKPPELSFADAACLPTAWLTAYRMLFVKSGLQPGGRVLVQGAGGGVATALIVLARAAGFEVWATSRDEAKRERARDLGAHHVVQSGARLPERMDAVMETVGAATWSHSLRSLRPGGRLVVSGATSGYAPSAELNRVFFLQLEVVGSTMGTRAELERLIRLCVVDGIRPVVDSVVPLERVADGLARVAGGDLFGKIVVRLADG